MGSDLVQYLSVFVPGDPVPQGSKKAFNLPAQMRAFLAGKTRTVIPVMVDVDSGLKPWRKSVAALCLASWGANPRLAGPVALALTFYLHRPKCHYGTGRNAETLKADAPKVWHTQAPDLDKLTRAVFDALTNAVFNDDSQVCCVLVEKRWADKGQKPGVRIEVFDAPLASWRTALG